MSRERLGSRLGFILYQMAYSWYLCRNWKKGWGWNNFVAETNSGKGLKVQKFMKGYITYVLPVIVFAIFAVGIYNFILGLK